MKRVIGILAFTFFVIIGDSQAQEWNSSEPKNNKRVAIAISWGSVRGGSASDIVKKMRETGFGETAPRGCFFSLCFDEKTYPNSYHDGWGKSIDVKYYFKEYLSVGLNYASVEALANVIGYHSEVGHLHLYNEVKSVGTVISIGVPDELMLGVGPALFFTNAHVSRFEKTTKTKPGVVFDFNLRIPRQSLLFVVIDMQYRIVAKTKIGPFTKEFYNNIATFPEMEVDYTNSTLSIGFGVRF